MTRVEIAAPRRVGAIDRLEAGLTAGVLAAAIAIRAAVPVDSNIAWLLSVARAVRDGARLDTDIVETNPPMAVWIHLPAVWLERLTGLHAETIFVTLALVLGTAAAWHLARRLADAGFGQRLDRPAILAAFVLTPLATFAERDHIALLLIAPTLATVALRLEGRRPPLAEIVIAGLAAGIAVMVKPQFAAPVAAVALLLAVTRRDPRAILLPEGVIAAAAFLAYAAGIGLALPVYYAEVVPVMLDLYRPARYGLLTLLADAKLAQLLLLAAQLALLRWRAGRTPGTDLILAAAAGFALGYLDQGRGGPYQLVPATSLILIATVRLVPAALAGRDTSRRLMAALACALGLWTLGQYTRFIHADPTLVAAIAAAAPAPTVTTIAIDLTPAHPLTTAVGGRWVGTYSSRWITGYADLRRRRSDDPAIIARADAWARHDRAVANRDLAERRPDIVVVARGWDAWIAADPETARLMANYRPLARQQAPAGDFEAVDVWIRADLVRAPQHD